MDQNKRYDPTIDSSFQKPYIDIEEDREEPCKHHYVHGGFEGTDLKFSLYFPVKEKYKKRFFHFLAAAQGSENASQQMRGENSMMSFASRHGAYLIESNMGGPDAMGEELLRSNAAVAVFSRTVAARIYGNHRPYGYLMGGSGGSLKTCACFENTEGIWDGAIPFVIACPMAIPNSFTVRAHATRILRKKILQIIDATDPGGNGDVYAGLDAKEKAALEEVTRMGFPPRTWFAHYFMGDGALPLLTPMITTADPGYYEDFWKVPGYLGADLQGTAHRDRIRFNTRIKSINIPDIIPKAEFKGTGVDDAWHVFDQLDRFVSPPTIELEDVPGGDLYLRGTQVIFVDGAAAGNGLPLGKLDGYTLTIGESFQPGLHQMLAQLKPGDSIRLDNSDYIALQTFHRHQVPEGDYAGWRQFRNDSGDPIYPQRPIIAPGMAYHGSGAVQNGRFKGKMIVVASLMDEAAFPWFADWYRSRVKENLGDQTDDHFRLWYMDHAMHAETVGVQSKLHVVGYMGALCQALLDLVDWVEKGIAPPASTNYVERDAQIIVPDDADERAGIQPVVTLLANGSTCARVSAGDLVRFEGSVTVPNGTGQILSAEWDFEEQGSFDTSAEIKYTNADKSTATTEITYIFKKPGTYFPVLRASTARNPDDVFVVINNLERVRVVVS